MRWAECQRLVSRPETGVWYRAVPPERWKTSLQTSHTVQYPSRFSAGPHSTTPFEILYLAETQELALWEVEATVGSWEKPGAARPNPMVSVVVIPATVRLQQIVDLTEPRIQSQLRTTAQELTGDWRGYHLRSHFTSVPAPGGIAPTQRLGAALYAVPGLEGFCTLSAKVPLYKALVLFPQKLLKGSLIEYRYKKQRVRIEGTL